MTNKFDPKAGTPDALAHGVHVGTLGGATSGRKGEANPGGTDGVGALSGGEKFVGKHSAGAKNHAGYLGTGNSPDSNPGVAK